VTSAVARGEDGRRGPLAATATALALLALGLAAFVSMRTEPPAAAPIDIGTLAAAAVTASPPARSVAPPRAGASNALRTTPSTPAPPLSRPVAATHSHAGVSPAVDDAPPYRYFGRSASGGDAAIVLSGRGRVVTLRGPGPLDEEYRVEAVFADYLLIRHGPTGRGSFLPLGQRRAVTEPLPGPEDSAQD
jgi:hypothetical protein